MNELHRWKQRDGSEWACAAYDHGPFCRLCNRIDPDDGIAHAMLDGVATGEYTVSTDKDGVLLFKLTEQGTAKARALIESMGFDPDDPAALEDAARQIVRNPDAN